MRYHGIALMVAATLVACDAGGLLIAERRMMDGAGGGGYATDGGGLDVAVEQQTPEDTGTGCQVCPEDGGE